MGVDNDGDVHLFESVHGLLLKEGTHPNTSVHCQVSQLLLGTVNPL